MSRSGSSVALVLDTSAYAALRSGDGRVLDAMASAAGVLVPAIVLGELEAGFEIGSRVAENRRMLAEFLEEPFVAILPITAGTASRYGRIFAQLRRDGTPIPTNDIWIAAATMAAGATLVTFDEHFGRVAGLSCTIYPP